ncbi:MAG: hypothetical protein CR984_04445 [Proteobacteria bacterium]|nr:MAG: hypothetical protein CR984_04445 [Pseudomonadota bacterium]PIE67378.1 MAG: hypothetical protein CSA23_03765 [Deltaproteobacteria bacterium]
MNPLGWRLPLVLALVWLTVVPMPTRAADPVVRLKGDRLTLKARSQPLAALLQELSDQGVRIRVDPRINPQITAAFTDRPIGPALNGILKSVNYALIWRKDKDAGNTEPRLWEIRIFYKGQEARIRPFPKRINLNVKRQTNGVFHVKDIILVKRSPDMSDAAFAALLDRLGATVLDANASMGIVRLRLPYGSDVPAIARIVARTPGIHQAEPDYAYRLKGGRPAAIPVSGTPPPPPAPSTGAATIAVMDSGLHGDYMHSPYVQSAYDAISPGAEISDTLGHGTQMALIAAGAVNPLGTDTQAAGSPVVAIRAFDDNGFTSTFTLMRGIDYAVANGARVLSLSWGSETTSTLLETATSYAADKGLILIAAAGNTPTGTPVYPAAYDNVIGVGALSPDGDHWDQSNYGDFVALSAPGVADLPVGYGGDPGIYAGTSIAAAYTARRAAAILDRNPNADRETILRLLAEEN